MTIQIDTDSLFEDGHEPTRKALQIATYIGLDMRAPQEVRDQANRDQFSLLMPFIFPGDHARDIN